MSSVVVRKDDVPFRVEIPCESVVSLRVLRHTVNNDYRADLVIDFVPYANGIDFAVESVDFNEFHKYLRKAFAGNFSRRTRVRYARVVYLNTKTNIIQLLI